MGVKTGWLVYYKKDYEKNSEFADRFLRYGAGLGLDITLIFREDIIYGIRDGRYFLNVRGNFHHIPDFIINRSMDSLLSKHLEGLRCRVFNSSAVSEMCNNKAKTYQQIATLKIPMVDTFFLTRELVLNEEYFFEYPVVVKTVGGRSGKEVCKADSYEAIRSFVKASSSDGFVVQKLCGMPGRDVRVFVIGKQIIGAVERYSDSDFRANFSLGGGARLYKLNREETAMVEKIITKYNFDMVGVDFIFDSEGRFLFNEIEDVVGTRTLYMNSDTDIAKLYLQYIKAQL